MKEPYPDELKQIDIRSEELMREFLEHKREAKVLEPEADDTRIFEAWAIQKISGLQQSILHLAAHLQDLQDRLRQSRQ